MEFPTGTEYVLFFYCILYCRVKLFGKFIKLLLAYFTSDYLCVAHSTNTICCYYVVKRNYYAAERDREGWCLQGSFLNGWVMSCCPELVFFYIVLSFFLSLCDLHAAVITPSGDWVARLVLMKNDFCVLFKLNCFSRVRVHFCAGWGKRKQCSLTDKSIIVWFVQKYRTTQTA